MSEKNIHKVIGFIVVCALLIGCLAGCGSAGNDSGGRQDENEDSGRVPDDDREEAAPPETSGTDPVQPDDGDTEEDGDQPDEDPGAESPSKLLRRETVTASGEFGVSVAVTEYLENGLGARVYSTGENGDETYEAFYDYDEYGAPNKMRMYLEDDAEAVIEIRNSYQNGRIVSAKIADIRIDGESVFDEDRMPDTVAFYGYLSIWLRFLQHFEGYRDAEISIRNTESYVRLERGEVVYSCSDMGYVSTTTRMTLGGDGHKIQIVTTGIPGREDDIPATMTETDEYGRMVQYGSLMGQQSTAIRIDYETRGDSDARQRTDVGRATVIRNDVNTGYSDDQLTELVSQYSFIYHFAGDVLVSSEVDLGTQKITCKYSDDGLLLRQVTENDMGDFIYSVATDYEYR